MDNKEEIYKELLTRCKTLFEIVKGNIDCNCDLCEDMNNRIVKLTSEINKVIE